MSKPNDEFLVWFRWAVTVGIAAASLYASLPQRSQNEDNHPSLAYNSEADALAWDAGAEPKGRRNCCSSVAQRHVQPRYYGRRRQAEEGDCRGCHE